jgi:hypothetical protein
MKSTYAEISSIRRSSADEALAALAQGTSETGAHFPAGDTFFRGSGHGEGHEGGEDDGELHFGRGMGVFGLLFGFSMGCRER